MHNIKQVLGNPTDIQKSLKLVEEEKNALKSQLDDKKIDDNSPLIQKIMETYERFCNKTLVLNEAGVGEKKEEEKKKKKIIPHNYPLSPRAKSPVFSPMVLKSTSYYSSPREDNLIQGNVNYSGNNPNKEKTNENQIQKFYEAPVSFRSIPKTPEEKVRGVLSGSQSTRNSTKKKIVFPTDDKEEEISNEKKAKATPNKHLGQKIRFKDV